VYFCVKNRLSIPTRIFGVKYLAGCYTPEPPWKGRESKKEGEVGQGAEEENGEKRRIGRRG
jgi:hypothetical protein